MKPLNDIRLYENWWQDCPFEKWFFEDLKNYWLCEPNLVYRNHFHIIIKLEKLYANS